MRKRFLRFYKIAMLAVFLCFMSLVRDTAGAEEDPWELMPSMWPGKGTIAYSFSSGEDPISCSVTEMAAEGDEGSTINTIPSDLVAITVGGEPIDPSCYSISVEEDSESPGTWRLTGIWNAIGGIALIDWSLPDFFRDKSDLPAIQEAEEAGPPALDDLSFWDITVDSSGCSFAAGYDPRPKVTIRAIDDSAELEEGVDFTVDTSFSERRCGSGNRLRIRWKNGSAKCSNVTNSKGYIERGTRFTIQILGNIIVWRGSRTRFFTVTGLLCRGFCQSRTALLRVRQIWVLWTGICISVPEKERARWERFPRFPIRQWYRRLFGMRPDVSRYPINMTVPPGRMNLICRSGRHGEGIINRILFW